MNKNKTMTLKEVLMKHKFNSGGHIDLASMEKKFIRKYKQLPYLWNPNHPDYNNKLKRNAGYDALMPIFRRYMPRATRFHIRQKINILRSCYRKERRKYLASSSIDPDGNLVFSYMPHSWKYKAMRFIDEEKDPDEANESETEVESEIPSLEYEDEQELEYTLETESGNEDPDASKNDITPIYLEEEHLEDDEDQKPFKRKSKREYLRSEAYENSYDDHTVQSFMEGEVLEKEFNAIGENVACKLQRMSMQQRYHAELLINKVLIKGLKESLTDTMDLMDLRNSWQNKLEEALTYNRASKKEEYRIHTSSKEDTKEEINSLTEDHSDEISEDK